MYLLFSYFHNCLQFVAAGGLQQLLEIFNSGILEPKEQESWTVVSANLLFQLVTVVTAFDTLPFHQQV